MYTLGRKEIELYGGSRRFLAQAAGGGLDHLLRCIAGGNGDTISCKEERVFARTTVEFEDVVAALKGLGQHAPHGVALGASDHGIRKEVVVFPGHLVEDESGRRLRHGKRGHASTSVRVECRPSRES